MRFRIQGIPRNRIQMFRLILHFAQTLSMDHCVMNVKPDPVSRNFAVWFQRHSSRYPRNLSGPGMLLSGCILLRQCFKSPLLIKCIIKLKLKNAGEPANPNWCACDAPFGIGITVDSILPFCPIRHEELFFVTCAVGCVTRRGDSPGHALDAKLNQVTCNVTGSASVPRLCNENTCHVVVLVSLYRWSTLPCMEPEPGLLNSLPWMRHIHIAPFVYRTKQCIVQLRSLGTLQAI